VRPIGEFLIQRLTSNMSDLILRWRKLWQGSTMNVYKKQPYEKQTNGENMTRNHHWHFWQCELVDETKGGIDLQTNRLNLSKKQMLRNVNVTKRLTFPKKVDIERASQRSLVQVPPNKWTWYLEVFCFHNMNRKIDKRKSFINIHRKKIRLGDKYQF